MINSAALPGLEAWEGWEANPFLEPGCLPGPLAVSWPRQRLSPASAPALELPQVSGPQVGGPGLPVPACGAAPPHCSRPGVAVGWRRSSRSALETRQTLTNLAWFPLTSLQPYLVAQPTPGAAAPFSAWSKDPNWPTEPGLDFLIQAGNSSEWLCGAQGLFCTCAPAGTRWALNRACSPDEPQRGQGETKPSGSGSCWF